MRGTSAASLEEVIARAQERCRVGLTPLDRVAEQLFAVADTIDSSNQLIRLLSDGGQAQDVKFSAVRHLLRERVCQEVLAIVLDAVAHRWAEQADLVEALERVGVIALLSLAEKEGDLDAVEDELFQLYRAIDSSRELAFALDDARRGGEERIAIIHRLIDGDASHVTRLLAERAVAHRGDRRPAQRILDLAEIASERRQRILAVVTSARPLTEQQLGRVSGILERIYGRAVQINTQVEDGLVGGLRISVGDDLYDASVLARVLEARARLAA